MPEQVSPPGDDVVEPVAGRRVVGIKDVAARAGVSWKTVTNVIHGRPNVSPVTRRNVERAISELGYRPSLAGRQLRRGRTGLLAVSVPDLATPYFTELARAIVRRARSDDYTVLIDETGHSVTRESAAARGYGVRFTDGVLLSPSRLSGSEVAALQTDTPIVLLGEQPDPGGLDFVGIDNAASARDAARHMLTLGRRRFAFLGAEIGPHRKASALRIAGLEAALAEAGSGASLNYIETSEYSRSEGFARARAAFSERRDWDALICASDMVAIGALHALASLGIRVPEEVAVLGWDNAPEAEYSWPPLTTIAPRMEEFGARAFQLLAARMADPTAPPRRGLVSHHLLVRASTLGSSAPFNPASPYQIWHDQPEPGRLIKEARQRVGITQRALAEAVGTSQGMIARYEAGAVSPTVRSLERILAAMGSTLRLDAQPADLP